MYFVKHRSVHNRVPGRDEPESLRKEYGYHDKVGLEAVQEVYAGRDYYECHVAVVLTNQTFTPAAIKLADKIGVVLWDRNTLRDLL